MVVFPLFCVRQSPWRACDGDSERLEEESLPRTAGIEKSIKPELDDVLDYHPREVISPDKAYDSPGKVTAPASPGCTLIPRQFGSRQWQRKAWSLDTAVSK